MTQFCFPLVIAAIAACVASPSAGDLTADDALVTLIEHVDAPARVAGLLSTVAVSEGAMVSADQLLAQVEDDDARLARDRAKLELQVAGREAENDVSVRFARKSAEVAAAELRRAVDSVEKYQKSISASEIDRLRLTAEQAALEIEQAEHDLDLARLKRDLAAKSLDTAEADLARHRLVAPFDGVVVDLQRSAGEWVEPGQTVLRLLRIDRLRVEAFLDAGQVSAEAVGQAATLRIAAPGETLVEFAGKVVFVSPEIDPVNGQVRVWAEVENRDRSLRPGARGTLTIHASAADTAVPR